MNIEDIFEEFCSKYRVKRHPTLKHIAKVTSPFSMINGDPVSFVVEILDDSTIKLSDDLLIFRYFDMNYYDPSENALDIASTVLASYSMKNEDYYVTKFIDITEDDIDDEISDYITGLIRLSDLTYLKRESIKKEFYEIVYGYIKENTKTKYHCYNTGINNSDYPIDIALSNDNNKWVGVYILPNHSRVLEATVSTLHYQLTGTDLFSVCIFDNIDTMLGGTKTKRLINLTDKAIIDFTQESKDIVLRSIDSHL